MNDLAAVLHWQPSELENLHWDELLDFRRDLPRVAALTRG
ncbi:GpE family phage tail protein [Breoghania sp.]|nr:GpE family phage tail protein [Breoghania sp.]